MQRVLGDGDHVRLVRVVRHDDLDLGVRVRPVDLKRGGEDVLAIVVDLVGLDPFQVHQAVGPIRPVRDLVAVRRVVVRHVTLLLLLSAASQKGRRRRATAGGKRTTAGESAADGIAAEARDIVRQAAGSVTGKTVAAQVRQAARNLGYPAESWRVREAWYGRAGAWSAAAVDELRRRFTEWRQRERVRIVPAALDERMTAMRDGLAELQRRLGDLELEIVRILGGDRSGYEQE